MKLFCLILLIATQAMAIPEKNIPTFLPEAADKLVTFWDIKPIKGLLLKDISNPKNKKTILAAYNLEETISLFNLHTRAITKNRIISFQSDKELDPIGVCRFEYWGLHQYFVASLENEIKGSHLVLPENAGVITVPTEIQTLIWAHLAKDPQVVSHAIEREEKPVISGILIGDKKYYLGEVVKDCGCNQHFVYTYESDQLKMVKQVLFPMCGT